MALPIDNSDFFSAYNSLSATAAPVDYGDTVDTDSMLQKYVERKRGGSAGEKGRERRRSLRLERVRQEQRQCWMERKYVQRKWGDFWKEGPLDIAPFIYKHIPLR